MCYGRREGALWETYGNPKRILWEEKGKATEARCYGTGGCCGRPIGTPWESYGRTKRRKRRPGDTDQGGCLRGRKRRQGVTEQVFLASVKANWSQSKRLV